MVQNWQYIPKQKENDHIFLFFALLFIYFLSGQTKMYLRTIKHFPGKFKVPEGHHSPKPAEILIFKIRLISFFKIVSIGRSKIGQLTFKQSIYGSPCLRKYLFMAASASFTLAGLFLGSSLIMLVSAMSDEFNSTSMSKVWHQGVQNKS